MTDAIPRFDCVWTLSSSSSPTLVPNMVEPTVVDDPVSLPPSPQWNPMPSSTATAAKDFESLPIFLSQDFTFPDNNHGTDPNSLFSSDRENDDFVDGNLDFDFTFEDFDDFVSSITNSPCHITPSDPVQIAIDSSDSYGFEPAAIVREPELRHVSAIGQAFTCGDDQSIGGGTVFIQEPHPICDGDWISGNFRASSSPSRESLSQIPGDQFFNVSKFLNVPSPESTGTDIKLSSNCPSSETEIVPASSKGSGNCGSNASKNLNYSLQDSGNSAARSVNSSPDFANNTKSGVVDQKIKLEEVSNSVLLKRKKENEDFQSLVEEVSNSVLLKRKKENEDFQSEPRTSKYQRSNTVNGSNNGSNAMSEEEEKIKARLVRNRESAQLSRQRKKHYVEELEDKLRTMHSTIHDLNSKISYIMAENASLRQQLGNNPVYPQPGVYPPPHPQMVYPWMPCPPYMVKPQSSQVPLVPIPRLKQQPASAPKAKKVETKKTEGRSKRVASISFLGLLFFVLLFGGLVPMVNVKYGAMKEEFMGRIDYAGSRVHEQHRERVRPVNSFFNGTDIDVGLGRNHASNRHCTTGKNGRAEPSINRGSFGHLGNGSEPLVASLYVPRNDRLVKIDGNLIIHSVLASEKAVASSENSPVKSDRETGLVVPGDLTPAIPGKHPHFYRGPTERQRALSSGSADGDSLKPTATDGKLQQWFREGLAGPMLGSGMCTEVFQFDVSSAIVPATTARNISAEHEHVKNSTHLTKGRNRRILHELPIPFTGSSHNITEEHANNSEKGNVRGNNYVPSMVVSVLVDPREAGDGNDGDNMMGPRSLSRIFVVVLLDSVKYVTYSCMLPVKGPGSHLVTA